MMMNGQQHDGGVRNGTGRNDDDDDDDVGGVGGVGGGEFSEVGSLRGEENGIRIDEGKHHGGTVENKNARARARARARTSLVVVDQSKEEDDEEEDEEEEPKKYPNDHLEKCGKWLQSLPRDDMLALRETPEYDEFILAFQKLGRAHQKVVTWNRNRMEVDATTRMKNNGQKENTGNDDDDDDNNGNGNGNDNDDDDDDDNTKNAHDYYDHDHHDHHPQQQQQHHHHHHHHHEADSNADDLPPTSSSSSASSATMAASSSDESNPDPDHPHHPQYQNGCRNSHGSSSSTTVSAPPPSSTTTTLAKLPSPSTLPTLRRGHARTRRRRLSNFSFLQHMAVDDVVLRVFEYLECESLIRTSETCSRFRELANQSAIQRTHAFASQRKLNQVMQLLRAKEQIEGDVPSLEEEEEEVMRLYFPQRPQRRRRPFVQVPMLGLPRRVIVTNAGDIEYNGVYYCTGNNANGFVFTKPRNPYSRIPRRQHPHPSSGGDDAGVHHGDWTSTRRIPPDQQQHRRRQQQQYQHQSQGSLSADTSDDTDYEPGRRLRCIIAKRFSNETILWYMSKEIWVPVIHRDDDTHRVTRVVEEDGYVTQLYSFWAKLMILGEATADKCRYPSQTSILTQSHRPPGNGNHNNDNNNDMNGFPNNHQGNNPPPHPPPPNPAAVAMGTAAAAGAGAAAPPPPPLPADPRGWQSLPSAASGRIFHHPSHHAAVMAARTSVGRDVRPPSVELLD